MCVLGNSANVWPVKYGWVSWRRDGRTDGRTSSSPRRMVICSNQTKAAAEMMVFGRCEKGMSLIKRDPWNPLLAMNMRAYTDTHTCAH